MTQLMLFLKYGMAQLGLINTNEVHIDNNVSLLGVTKDDTDLGAFTLVAVMMSMMTMV